jgi:hypothetical protein
MAVETHISDLLPPIYDMLVQKYTSKVLLAPERESILHSLINSIQWTVLRQVREEKEKEGAPDYIDELRTSDRFTSKWMSRLEVVDRIEYSSGLGRPLAQLALLLIEMRVDLALVAGDGLSIESVCEIKSPYEDQGSTSPHFSIEDTYRRMCEILYYWEASEKSLVARLWPQSASRNLSDTVEKMEVVASFRRPVSYNLKLSQVLAFSRQALSPARFLEVPIDSLTRLPFGDLEHRFHWEEGEEESKVIDLTVLAQLRGKFNRFLGRN